MKCLIIRSFILSTLLSLTVSTYPIAIFHGIDSSCDSLISLCSHLKERLLVDVKCIEIGNGAETSKWTSMNSQSKEACSKIAGDPVYENKDISVIGISQGGLIARYIVEKCQFGGKVKRFISLSTPHMGIASVNVKKFGKIAEKYDKQLRNINYFMWAQNHFAPSNYLKDRYNYQNYLNYSSFLPDLNNEKSLKNPVYKLRMICLEKVLLVVNEADDVIIPPTSGWFNFFKTNSNELEYRRDSEFYIKDYIGIRKLEEDNRISFVLFKGMHTQYTFDEINRYFIPILS
jgi:palmitoyl-protein thioesterase